MPVYTSNEGAEWWTLKCMNGKIIRSGFKAGIGMGVNFNTLEKCWTSF